MHSQIYYNEAGYQQLLTNIITDGIQTPDRTGVGRQKLFDQKLIFDLSNNTFPAHTLRPCPVRIAFEEFWAFLNGIVYIHPHLSQRNVHIWQGNTTREFLDKRGLYNLPEGHLGKSYGFQFRNYNGRYDRTFNPKGGVDQIRAVYKSLKHDPYGSRHYVNIWNPAQEKDMALPPCWLAHQFIVLPDNNGTPTLNLKTYARSADVLFGTPFNVQQYALYQMAMAEALGMKCGMLSCDMADAHLYINQLDYATEATQREIHSAPTLQWNRTISSLDDVLSLRLEDFELIGLQVNKSPFVSPKPPMAV